MTLQVYLGPYIEVTVRDASREVDAWGCTNEACPNYTARYGRAPVDEKFCPRCGTPTGKSKKTEKVRTSAFAVLGGDQRLEVFIDDPKAKTVLVPSKPPWRPGLSRGPANPPYPREFRTDDECSWDLTTIKRGGEMLWLHDTFAEEIEKLKTAFDDVTVKWGLHAWMDNS